MAPFVYQDEQNPFAMSIAQVMGHRGDIAASGARDVAAMQARAAEISGQARAQAVQGLAAIPQQMEQARAAAQDREMRQRTLDHARAADRIGGLITASMTTTPDGHLVYDTDAFLKNVQAHPELAAVAHEPLDAMSKANVAYQDYTQNKTATKVQTLSNVLARAAEAGGTADDLQVIAAPFVTAGVLSAGDILPWVQRVGGVPDQNARVKILNGAAGVKPTYQSVAKDAQLVELSPGAAPTVAVTGQKGAPTAEEAKIDSYIGSLNLPTGTRWESLTPEQKAGFGSYAPGPVSLESKNVTLDGKPNQLVNFNPRTGEMFAPGSKDPIDPSRIRGNTPASVVIHNSTASEGPGDYAKTGADFLKTIPVSWRKTVEKIANYEEDPTKVASMRGGQREQITKWVNQVNPEYDQSLFANRSPTRKAFTTGVQGQQINAINTAIGHIDMLTSMADQLGNGSFVPGNKAFNAVQTAFGSAKVTNFDTLKDALAGEVASVLSKGAATVSGIEEARQKINAANSPQQLAGYVKTLIPVMGSKLAALDYQYHQAMGVNDPFSALSPETKSVLAKHGVDLSYKPPTSAAPAAAGVIRARDPQGNLHEAAAGTALPSGWTLEK